MKNAILLTLLIQSSSAFSQNGLIFELSNTYIEKGSSTGWTIEEEAPVLPSLGVGLVFHL